MTPLTVDCARVRQLLPDLVDGPPPGPLPGAPVDDGPAHDRAFAEEHLLTCVGCREARDQIAAALGALEHLSPEDVARLRALADGELDPRPLARLAGACIALVLLLVVGVVVATAPRNGRAPGAPTPPAVVVHAPAPLHIAVGAELGIEVEPDLTPAPIELPSTDAPAEEPRPQVREGGPPAAPEVVAVAAPPAPAAPDAAAPAPAPAPARPQPARVQPPPPDELTAMFARLELSDGVRFRDVTLFFARDPAARDRLGRGRAPSLPAVREASAPEPERCVVRPPSGASSYRVLAGELLDAPCGLRLTTAAVKVSGRTELVVRPAGFDALAAIEGRARRAPVLRAPVLVTSRARAALIEGVEPGPVAVFLEVMADPTLLDFERLRRELARIEPEARDLERRLRASLEDLRGLRAVAVSVGGTARCVDVFDSSRDLGDALPRLLRTALLEAAFELPQGDGALGADPRGAQLELGVTDTRERHQQLIAAFAGCRLRKDADDVYERVGGAEVGAIWVKGDDLLQATMVHRP